MDHRAPSRQEQSRAFLGTGHQRLMVLIEHKDGHAYDLSASCEAPLRGW
jgi:hypothetical protein